MATIPCPDCKQPVSPTALKCMHCGRPLVENGLKSLGCGCLGIVVLAVLFNLFGWCS